MKNLGGKLTIKPKCPVCGTITGGSVLSKTHRYTVHQCSLCQLRFSNPMSHPGFEWYEKASHYRRAVAESLNLPLWIIQRDWRLRTFLALKLRPGGNLLDIGCGPGTFLRLAKSYGYKVAGIDVSNKAIKVTQEKFGLFDTHTMSVEELITKSWQRRFDIICLFDVLEHLENPVAVLLGLKKLLKPGGYVVCTVPSYRRWPPIFDPYVDLPPHHLTLWTPMALERCISVASLKVTKIIRSPLASESLCPNMLWHFRPLLQLGVVSTLIKGITYFIVTPPIVKVLSLNPRAGGFTLMIVARKNHVSVNED